MEYLAALSLLPIAVVALFLVVLRWPASRAMPLSYLTAALLALLVWKVTPDRRIQVILIAWLFGSFIEGAAGFGTPPWYRD